MPNRDIIVIGASSGGVPALKALVAALPRDLPASLFVVLHVSAGSRGLLPVILSKAGPLPALVPNDESAIEQGRIYVAPPDRHLLIERDKVRVVRGPKENRHRPAIDPLFRSAAWTYGPRVVGVVLSGELDDGSAGLWAIKSCGGTTVVQDPAEAESKSMPRSALAQMHIDHCLPLAGIAELLVRFAGEPVEPAPAPAQRAKVDAEIKFAHFDADMQDMSKVGRLSPFTCPTCRGALWELAEGDLLRYRCHTGHAFSAESLLAEQSTAVENALYSALRIVEEKAAALRRFGERKLAVPDDVLTHYHDRASELDATAEELRRLLAGEGS